VKVAFCGLGQMGTPMAHRLLEEGHSVTVWNRTASKAEPLRERGAIVAQTPAAAAEGAEAVLTMLATPEAVDAVVLGTDGMSAGMAPGSTLIEMSTIGMAAVRELAGRLREDVRLVDAPVLGSVPQAETGELKVFVGADDETFGRWRGLLGTFGTVFHLGPLGAGAAMKLVVNSTLGALMTGLAEALALADRLDLDRRTVLDILADSNIGVTVRGKRERIESGVYPPRFKLELAAKDLRLVEEAAREAGLDARLAAAARAWFEEAAAAGLGDRDYSAVVAHALGEPADLPDDAG
jgi:3-hydroxyisobutyrate dehydrogenase-like beta-hydroxyacid dehydrogenase